MSEGKGRILSARQLQNLKLYKYSGVDRSYLTRYVLNPFWNWLVTLFPLWMAPNLITLLGLMFMVSATLLVFIFHQQPPRILYFYIFFCISTYLNMDAIDGKQARRTGTSSPLGELFDHGCDAINLMLMAVLIPFICGIPLGPSHTAILLSGFLAFLGSTWEEWHTGILYLGIVSGPVEGAWSLALVSLLSGIYGSTDIWTLPRHIPLIGTFPLNNIVLYGFVLGACNTIITSCVHVVRKSGFPALLHLLWPLTFFTACAMISLVMPQVYASQMNFYWFTFFCGLPTCFRVSSTIVSYVTKSPLPRPTFLELFPFILMVLNRSGLDGMMVLKCMTILSALTYARFVLLVINDLCSHLGINCLTIKKRSQ